MYPNDIIPGIDLYSVCIALGIASAIFVYRITADKVRINASVFNFSLICAVFAIIIGFFSAVVFQALYNIKERGAFIIDNNTGATFAGGLIGGAFSFLAIYFLFGKKVSQSCKKEMLNIVNCAACAIPTAHAFGRIGCLMAGCCYGNKTDSFIGIYMKNLGYKVVPIQLFEAIFLAFLAVFLIISIHKSSKFTMCIYMISYGTWRFIIEFFRADDRGTSFVSFLSPSQLISVFLIIGALSLYVFQKRYYAKEVTNE